MGAAEARQSVLVERSIARAQKIQLESLQRQLQARAHAHPCLQHPACSGPDPPAHA
jgi:hypothetical protein